MKKFKTLTLILCISLGTFAQEKDSFKEIFTEHLTLSNSKANFEMMMKQLLGMAKMQHSQLSEAQWDELTKEFSTKFFAIVIEDMMPLYKKHFTEKELKEVNQFFKSKVGKKYATSSTQVTQESMQFAQKWAGQMPAMVGDIIKEKGWK